MIVGGIDLVVPQLNQLSPALGIRVGYVYLAVPVSGFFCFFTRESPWERIGNIQS